MQKTNKFKTIDGIKVRKIDSEYWYSYPDFADKQTLKDLALNARKKGFKARVVKVDDYGTYGLFTFPEGDWRDSFEQKSMDSPYDVVPKMNFTFKGRDVLINDVGTVIEMHPDYYEFIKHQSLGYEYDCGRVEIKMPTKGYPEFQKLKKKLGLGKPKELAWAFERPMFVLYEKVGYMIAPAFE